MLPSGSPSKESSQYVTRMLLLLGGGGGYSSADNRVAGLVVMILPLCRDSHVMDLDVGLVWRIDRVVV